MDTNIKAEVIIHTNKNKLKERIYIYDYFFHDRLGISYELRHWDASENYTQLTLPNGKTLKLADVFFNTTNWLGSSSLPVLPLKYVDASSLMFSNNLKESQIPILYGGDDKIFDEQNSLSIDVFGSAFFYLSGYEEYLNDEVNEHGNFPFEKSITSHENLIKRPLVDEYFHLLELLILSLCPMEVKKRDFKFIPTHDIDVPFKYYDFSVLYNIKSSLGDLVKRRSFSEFIHRNLSFFGRGRKDPFNVYKWLMDISNKYNLINIFYFKNSLASSKQDFPYRTDTPALKKALKEIDKNGHIIGFHPSYKAYNSKQLFKEEIEGFRYNCNKLGLHQEIVQVRQHYLRYDISITSKIQEENKFITDSTLGFNDITGFRRGTCFEFPVFDLPERRKLTVTEIPLILMEVSLMREAKDEKLQLSIAKNLIESCKFYQGNFVLLWHNNRLENKKDRFLYTEIIKMSKC